MTFLINTLIFSAIFYGLYYLVNYWVKVCPAQTSFAEPIKDPSTLTIDGIGSSPYMLDVDIKLDYQVYYEFVSVMRMPIFPVHRIVAFDRIDLENHPYQYYYTGMSFREVLCIYLKWWSVPAGAIVALCISTSEVTVY